MLLSATYSDGTPLTPINDAMQGGPDDVEVDKHEIDFPVELKKKPGRKY